jgi:His-Xaa-Ser system radical SAM maturase HxsC
MLPLHTHATVRGVTRPTICKVLTGGEARKGVFPPEHCLLWAVPGTRIEPGWAGFFSPADLPETGSGIQVGQLRHPAVVAPGDVIRLQPNKSLVSVLYRRGANSNTLLATERCNSRCLMCSQPPRSEDDGWRVWEMKSVISLTDKDAPELGISGGEPTLLAQALLEIITLCAHELPHTSLHILSNGRRFADEAYAKQACDVGHPDLVWGIPLYAPTPAVHDYVVQAPGAFEETLCGFYNLARHRGRIELRVVLQQPTVPSLGELARFIYRNLPFAEHVAFMGLEPMGYARRNHPLLWLDPLDYAPQLEDAVFLLQNRGMTVSIYNLPFCVLPRTLWPFARQSISDWKQTLAPECGPCVLRGRCPGFFVSASHAWRSRGIRPVTALDQQAREGALP